jgi:hypothetical protein
MDGKMDMEGVETGKGREEKELFCPPVKKSG